MGNQQEQRGQSYALRPRRKQCEACPGRRPGNQHASDEITRRCTDEHYPESEKCSTTPCCVHFHLLLTQTLCAIRRSPFDPLRARSEFDWTNGHQVTEKPFGVLRPGSGRTGKVWHRW